MNPYDFVPVDWTREPQRQPAAAHDRFSGLSGRLEAVITAERPLFLPAKRRDGQPDTEMSGATRFCGSRAYQSEQNRDGLFLPGSSLKGLFRSIVETTAQGCIWFCKDSQGVPAPFQPCSSLDALCPACRLFGLINGRTHRLGNVGFEDAVCTNAVRHDAIYTVILSGPKPEHVAFYRDGRRIAGRKFYFHHLQDNLLTASGWLPLKGSADRRQNAFIHPVGEGSTFTFRAEFTSVAEQELAALFYALTLEPGLRHKFGYAKPCGLGSIRVELTGLTLRDTRARYRGGTPEQRFEGDALRGEVARRVEPFTAAIPAVTRAGLRRIWQWPPAADVSYTYPGRAWFDENPLAPISATP